MLTKCHFSHTRLHRFITRWLWFGFLRIILYVGSTGFIFTFLFYFQATFDDICLDHAPYKDCQRHLPAYDEGTNGKIFCWLFLYCWPFSFSTYQYWASFLLASVFRSSRSSRTAYRIGLQLEICQECDELALRWILGVPSLLLDHGVVLGQSVFAEFTKSDI